jgi:hypothetical protein
MFLLENVQADDAADLVCVSSFMCAVCMHDSIKPN